MTSVVLAVVFEDEDAHTYLHHISRTRCRIMTPSTQTSIGKRRDHSRRTSGLLLPWCASAYVFGRSSRRSSYFLSPSVTKKVGHPRPLQRTSRVSLASKSATANSTTFSCFSRPSPPAVCQSAERRLTAATLTSASTARRVVVVLLLHFWEATMKKTTLPPPRATLLLQRPIPPPPWMTRQ